jgi:hypothetical protein
VEESVQYPRGDSEQIIREEAIAQDRSRSSSNLEMKIWKP